MRYLHLLQKKYIPRTRLLSATPLMFVIKTLRVKAGPDTLKVWLLLFQGCLTNPSKQCLFWRKRPPTAFHHQILGKILQTHQHCFCPTLRTSDGLALSSRNVRLDDQGRLLAPKIFENLLVVKNMAKDSSL